MTFKWPGTPPASASPGELADYVELCCWRDGRSSMTDVSRQLLRLEDNDYSSEKGVPIDEASDLAVEEAFSEVECRGAVCGSGYPFELSEDGEALFAREGQNGSRQLVDRYLLLATRLNMKNHRTHAEIDGTLLLEDLGAGVAQAYLGAGARGVVFGVRAGGSGFAERVNELCARMGEGGHYVNRGGEASSENDGKLDVAVWKHFTDRLPGKLIAFGQCKTGTSYRNELQQLQPDAFCKKWMRDSPAVTPVRMFFVAEATPRDGIFNFSVDAGVVFDRCRIVEYSGEIGEPVCSKLDCWTAAAADFAQLGHLSGGDGGGTS